MPMAQYQDPGCRTACNCSWPGGGTSELGNPHVLASGNYDAAAKRATSGYTCVQHMYIPLPGPDMVGVMDAHD